MEPDQPLSRAEAQALLSYAELTYRSMTATRRRVAMAALTVALLFALIAVGGAVQWASTQSRLAAVEDAPLVEALGVEIPDPRPAIERGQLRLQALVWQVVTLTAGASALLFGALYLLARPPTGPKAASP